MAMIQDITPHRYDNAFSARRMPGPEDPVLCYRKETVLLRRKGDEIEFLQVKDFLPGEPPELGIGHGDEQTEARGGAEKPVDDGFYPIGGLTFIYLFSIDGIPYYSIDELPEDREPCGEQISWESVRIFRLVQPLYRAYAVITGMQLARWREHHHFCGRCGSPLHPSQTERAYVCSNCRSVIYPRICPAVIVAVTHGDYILLTKYAGRDYANYALIAGFAEVGETIEDTVHREVMEEVGLRVKNLRFYKSQPWSLSDTLLMGFFCELDGDENITLDREELAVGEWKKRSEMPDRRGDVSLTSEMMEQFRLGLDPLRHT